MWTMLPGFPFSNRRADAEQDQGLGRYPGFVRFSSREFQGDGRRKFLQLQPFRFASVHGPSATS
jgi:hypothetical protein